MYLVHTGYWCSSRSTVQVHSPMMDKLIAGFSRVARKIDDAAQLAADFDVLIRTAREASTSLSAQDKQRLLDLPEPEEQLKVIMAAAAAPGTATRGSKADLLLRAVQSPRELTDAEAKLLSRRYWHDYPTDDERAAAVAAHELFDGNDDAWRAAYNELQAVRASLYDDENEAGALENGQKEASRRSRERALEAAVAEKEAKCLRTMALAQPWVRRVWEEDGGFESHRKWGFAYFIVPSVMEDEKIADDYVNRAANVLEYGRHAVACGDALDRRWKYQRLDWPKGMPETRLRAAGENVEASVRMLPIKKWSDASLDGLDDNAAPPREEPRLDPGVFDEEIIATTDRARLEIVQNLRARFTSIRDEGGLQPGVLPNVFIVVDQDCVNSTIGPTKGVVDWMWVWAVDPDYKDDNPETNIPSSSSEQVYRGILRVRLQQLVNNFYQLRRFHEQDWPMERLWHMSRRSRDHIFFSIHEEELGQYTVARDIGSVIRAPGRVLRDQHGAELRLI